MNNAGIKLSAGGVVLRKTHGVLAILVVKRSHGIEPKWLPVLCQLPKGEVEANETLEQAAQREVLEETGYVTKILGKAGTACWRYSRDGRPWIETVHYFLMRPESIPPQTHDAEFDEVCWLTTGEVFNTLSYPEERALVTDIIADASTRL